jgi:maleylpyruvate isomerase
MKLYSYFRSSAAFRVRIALNLKKLDYEIIPIHLVKEGGQQHSQTYRALNPQGLVPALEDEGHLITQSLAIMEYLEEQFPTPSILPSDPVLKAQSRAVALSIACDIHPIDNLRVLQYLTHELKVSEDQKNTWYAHWIRIGFDALEKQLSAVAHLGKYCFGDIPTFADICLIPQMANAHRFKIDVTPYPRLVAIEQECLKLPAFINALPANQPDAE